jgi:hypothetical protein
VAGVRDELGALDAFVAGRSGLKHHGRYLCGHQGCGQLVGRRRADRAARARRGAEALIAQGDVISAADTKRMADWAFGEGGGIGVPIDNVGGMASGQASRRQPSISVGDAAISASGDRKRDR